MEQQSRKRREEGLKVQTPGGQTAASERERERKRKKGAEKSDHDSNLGKHTNIQSQTIERR